MDSIRMRLVPLLIAVVVAGEISARHRQREGDGGNENLQACSLRVTLSPSSGSPMSVPDRGRRPGSEAVSPTSSNHPGQSLLLS